ERIAAFLADLASSVLSKSRASGLFVTGGDIAVHVFGRLGAKGAVLLREIEPGIPLTTLLGGAYHGMPVITKAGAFGDENTLCRSVKLLVGQR
ncbi:MAG TPA: nucleotide-binding domain containing protein, partial [Thermosynergistes sp.]|nr:nucleotide-binding domain containing protein [Thermosynergistes sp.]